MHGSCPASSLVGTEQASTLDPHSSSGLIYVNPEGVLGSGGAPNLTLSARDIRAIFAKMGMNDSETVALVGGGHSVGKAHGPCPHGGGLPPKEQPARPWVGACGAGKGADAFTSGFELPWTEEPVTWDNGFFKVLLKYEPWVSEVGPGGKTQWRPSKGRPVAPPVSPGGLPEPLGMLTSDVALLLDPAYRELVEQFARDAPAFELAFAAAWYKLTTQDMGPRARCRGGMVPPPQVRLEVTKYPLSPGSTSSPRPPAPPPTTPQCAPTSGRSSGTTGASDR